MGKNTRSFEVYVNSFVRNSITGKAILRVHSVEHWYHKHKNKRTFCLSFIKINKEADKEKANNKDV